MGVEAGIMPVVSKIFCSPSPAMLIIRKRPRVVNGGGFVVTNFTQKLLFTVDGCGTLGTEGELMLSDGDGAPILFVRKQGGIIQALGVQNKWKGYLMDYEGVGRPVFSLREPKSNLIKNTTIKVSIEEHKGKRKEWDFEIKGSFVERTCTINDRGGNVIAQMGVKEEVMASKDLYHVVVRPGYDQAIIVGVIAVLDNIYQESTTC